MFSILFFGSVLDLFWIYGGGGGHRHDGPSLQMRRDFVIHRYRINSVFNILITKDKVHFLIFLLQRTRFIFVIQKQYYAPVVCIITTIPAYISVREE